MTPPPTKRTQFRCRCGRSVSVPQGSAAAEAHACSRCRVVDANLLATRTGLVREPRTA